jgi:hypothetical protein
MGRCFRMWEPLIPLELGDGCRIREGEGGEQGNEGQQILELDRLDSFGDFARAGFAANCMHKSLFFKHLHLVLCVRREGGRDATVRCRYVNNCDMLGGSDDECIYTYRATAWRVEYGGKGGKREIGLEFFWQGGALIGGSRFRFLGSFQFSRQSI